MYNNIKQLFTGAQGEIRYSILAPIELDFSARNYLSFKYVLEGQERYYVNREYFSMKPGEVLLFAQGHNYTAQTKDAQKIRGLCIDLDSQYIEQARNNLLGEGPLFSLEVDAFQSVKIPDIPENIQKQLEALPSVSSSADGLAYEELLISLMEFYLSLEEEYTRKVKEIPVLKSSVKQELFARLLVARTYLFDNRQGRISLDELARVAGLSKFYFVRLFKQVFGITPAKLHEKLKLEYALEELQKGETDMYSIAHHLGYEDLSYFSRRFKQYFGVRPRQVTKKK